MTVEQNCRFSELIDCYGKLLSERQKNIISFYVNDDMSLAEIAENERISRTAVLDAVKVAEEKLEHYEEVLKLLELKHKLSGVLKLSETEIKNEIQKILEEY